MATKAKTKKKRAKKNAPSPFDQARQLFQRGALKDALKQAKVCYRQDPSADHQSILVCIYMARIEQLIGRGMHADARRVLGDFQALKITDPVVQTALPELLVRLGRLDQALAVAGDLTAADTDRLVRQAVDEAVTHGSDLPGDAGLSRQVGAIRTALDLLYQGDQTAARAQLAGIDRHSPLADWVLFVRGLAAYYAGDDDRMRASWDRLDPDRAAQRIAKPLRWLAEDVLWQSATPEIQDAVRQIERAVTGQSLLPYYAELQSVLGDDADLESLDSVLRKLAVEMCDTDPHEKRELTQFVLSHMTDDVDIHELARTLRLLESLPHDPTWDATLAVVAECNDDSCSFEDQVGYWRRYLEAVRHNRQISDDDRRVIAGLVHHHIAELHQVEAEEYRTCSCGLSHEEEATAEDAQAVPHLQEAVRCVPEYAAPQEELVAMYTKAGMLDAAVAAAESGLQHLPDNQELLLGLANLLLPDRNPPRGLECIRQVRAGRPLDEELREIEWRAGLAVAHHYVTEGRFDEGLEALDAAVALVPERRDSPMFMAQRIVYATVAGDLQTARQLTRAGESRETSYTVGLWLALDIEYLRNAVAVKERVRVSQAWQQALRGRRQGATAAALCRVLVDERQLQGDGESMSGQMVPGEYADQVADYLRRGAVLKWTIHDSVAVCEFCLQQEDGETLLRFAKKLVKRFPEDPFFHVCVGVGTVLSTKTPGFWTMKTVLNSLQTAKRLLDEGKGSAHPHMATVYRRHIGRFAHMLDL